MKLTLTYLLILSTFLTLQAQDKTTLPQPTHQPKIDTLSNNIQNQIQNQIQTLTQKTNPTQLTESKERLSNKTEHLKSKFTTLTDTIKTDTLHQKAFKNLQSKQQALQSKIQNQQENLNEKTALPEGLKEMSNELGFKTQPSGTSAPVTVPGAETISDPFKEVVPSNLDLPAMNMGEISPNVLEEQLQVPDTKNLLNATEIGPLKEIQQIRERAGEVGQLSEKTTQYTEDFNRLKTEGSIENPELTKFLEHRASEYAGMDNLPNQGNLLNQTKEFKAKQAQIQKYADQQAMREEAKKKAVTMAQQKLASNTVALNQAQERMGKLKKKYSSVQSMKDLNDIPKLKPNSLKGKPFKDRFTYGFNMQINKMPQTAIDFSPLMAYKISGTFTAGLSGSWRTDFGEDNQTVNFDHPVYGYRAFVDVKGYKKFKAHLEIEWMNTRIPPSQTVNDDITERAWVRGLLFGISKHYTISDGLQGNVQLLHNFDFRKDVSPYSRKFMIRFGIEFGSKQRRKLAKRLLSNAEANAIEKKRQKEGVEVQ